MKKIIISFLIACNLTIHADGLALRGFEVALQECKNGDYVKAWQYKGCTLHELEGLVDRLSAAINSPLYYSQFPQQYPCYFGRGEPLNLHEYFGDDVQSAKGSWSFLLPFACSPESDVQLLRTLLLAEEPAFAALPFTPGQMVCALLCFAQFSGHDLFNQDVATYKEQYKQSCGLRWFPLIMAQAYGDFLWRDATAARVILGDAVEVAWALPVALARYVCAGSPVQENEIDHKAIVIGLLDEKLAEIARLRFAYHHVCK